MVTIPCTGQSEARGRNRWFRLAEAELTLFHHGHADEARLCLDLFSRRRGRSAPVILLLTAADATALAQALQGAVQQLAAVLRGSDGTRGDGGRHRPSRASCTTCKHDTRPAPSGPGIHDGGTASTSTPVDWGHQPPACRCRGSTR